MHDDAIHGLVEKSHLEALRGMDPARLKAWRSRKLGNTLLHHAARHGADAAGLVCVLLEAGLDVNARNLRGQTPMMMIFERPVQQSMDWLLALTRAGARLDLYPANGQGFVYQCVSHHRWDALSHALQQGVPRHDDRVAWEGSAEYALLEQDQRGRARNDAVSWFNHLDQIAPPSQADRNRAFLLSMRLEKLKCANHFFTQGVSLLARDDLGNTVPHLIAAYARYRREIPKQYLDWMQQAVAQGVDLTLQNEKNKSALDLVSESAQPEQLHALHQAISEGQARRLHGDSHPVSQARMTRRF